MNEYIVIGAGIAGLTIAKRLNCPIIEKSRGVGGRMATRRIDEEKFDHGNPCWPESMRTQELHRGCHVPGGMTALPKKIAKGLDIILETRVLKLHRHHDHWVLETDKGEYTSKKVILTAPLPQALGLLDESNIAYEAHWKMAYHKSIVGLYRLPLDPKAHDILREHQVYFMKNRGLCEDGISFYLSAALSEEWFELTDVEILDRTTRLLWTYMTEKPLFHAEIKKWRYSTPETSHNTPFLKPAPGLILCGDGFLYPGIEGSLASAESVLRDLLK